MQLMAFYRSWDQTETVSIPTEYFKLFLQPFLLGKILFHGMIFHGMIFHRMIFHCQTSPKSTKIICFETSDNP